MTFGNNSDDQSVTKQMTGAKFESFDHLKQTMRQLFDFADDEFLIKFLNEDGSTHELGGNNFEQIKEIGIQSKIHLEIELLNPEQSYEDDEFDEKAESERQMLEPVSEDQVKMRFQELKSIL